VLAVLGGVGLVLAPVYMLRLFQGTMQGEPLEKKPMPDIRAGQLLLLSPLVLLMFVLGLYPNLLTQLMSALGQAGLAR
jgi:NADH-quinone oxidoreductase subunit M